MAKSRSRAVDHLGFIKRTLEELGGYQTLAFELIQNADDSEARWLRFDVRDDALWVEDDGEFSDCGDQDLSPDECLFLRSEGHRCDFHSFRLLSGADKRTREDTTGAMGIGFTAVYQITDQPEIISGRRHWTIDETKSEDDRITEEELDEPHRGTRIILPWARNARSPFRVKVEAAPAPEDVGEQLLDALDVVLGPVMLFLRNVEIIELALDGEVSRRVEREADGSDILINDGGEERRWRILAGDFTEAANDLRIKHGNLIEDGRLPEVSLAVPCNFDANGLLCATLPTAASSGLPIHVNAELYLTSDRRELAMRTDHQLDWNRAALTCAAELLADSLEELPGLLGPIRLWELLQGARETASTRTDSVKEALGQFWECLEPEIPYHDLVWTSREEWSRVSEARYAQQSEDEAAFEVLEALDLDLVHPSLRSMQNILLAVGVKRLAVEDIAGALRDQGLDEPTPLEALPEPVGTDARRVQLWSQLGRMISRLSTPEQKAAAGAALEGAAAVPSLAGDLAPIESVWRTDKRSLELLHRVAARAPFLDIERLPSEAIPLGNLCDPLGPGDAVAELEGAELELNLDDARSLVGWFAQREDDLDEDVRVNLANLRVFPSGDGFHALSELALPGDFEDPLDLALLVDEQLAREHGAFLIRLGVEQLTFVLYSSEQVPRAFDEGGLNPDQRRKVVSLLAQRRGELDDAPEAKDALVDLCLVECTDGNWREPEKAYFETSAVTEVLGDGQAFAAIPDTHKSAVTEFLAWLGVAAEPRPRDVVARAQYVSGQSVTAANRTFVERIVQWLGSNWLLRDDDQRNAFEELRSIAWLPARDSSEWHEPKVLDLVYRDYLYESQGLFLDLRRPVQTANGEVLRWLGLKDDPSVPQVVDHLRHCEEVNAQPNREVYGFLNLHAATPEVRALADFPCLHIGGRWLKPSEVFWTDPGFDRWRIHLGHEFARYRTLFDELQVKEAPDAEDAIAVMRDISAEYGPANLPVDEVDRYVLLKCWQLCDAGMSQAQLDAEDLRCLASEKLVADDRSVLMPPGVLYFEDLPGLAEQLPGIRQHIIRRPDGAWRAMQAAGVRDLSKAAVANVVEVGDRLDHDGLHARLSEREEELARVISPGSELSWREFSSQLHELDLLTVTSLTVAWELEAFGQRFPGDAHDAEALWQLQEAKLYVVVDDDGVPVWEGVARELVRALLPEIEPASVALGIAAALGHDDRDSARRALNAAGYPQLAPELKAEISTSRATGLDAKEAPGPRSDRDQDGEAGDEPSAPDKEPDPGERAVEEAEATGDDQADEEEQEGKEEEPAHDGVGVTGDEDASTGEGDGRAINDRGAADEKGDQSDGQSTTRQPVKRRSRLRSYVIPRGEESAEAEGSDQDDPRTDVDEAGIAAVVRLEKAEGRCPEVMPHNNKGYDIRSKHEDGEIARYIEVKSTRGPWDQFGVGVSDAQFEHAQLVEHQFWLYVVEHALSTEMRQIWCISNPANQVTDFMFDDGWKGLAEPADGMAAPDAIDVESDPAPSEA